MKVRDDDWLQGFLIGAVSTVTGIIIGQLLLHVLLQ
jgi:hypothetical protein